MPIRFTEKGGIDMKKRILSLLLSLSLAGSTAVLFTGCGKGNDSELVYVHSWTEEGLGGHYYSGASMGPVSWYVVEGLGDFLRTQDYVYYTTAKEIVHEEASSVVELRDDVYWQGYDMRFTAKDVVAFFYLNNTSLTKYVTKIEAEDDTHVRFYWNDKFRLADEIRTLLLVTDRVACVPYDVFKTYADAAIAVYDNAAISETNDALTFGRELTTEESVALADNYSKYQAFVPEYFPATGPYTIARYDANEMILQRNEKWYDVRNVGFERIKLINSVGDASLFSSMLIGGDIDLWLNTPSKPVVESILSANKDIVFYKVSSPYSHGVKFNMQKQNTLWTAKVREAFQYLFDRDEVRSLACYYASTSYTPMTGMTDTDMATWMSEGAHKELATNFTYSYDWGKAESLLKEAGWNRRSGKWYDANGKLVEIVIGYDGSNSVPSTVAEAVAAQMTNFGLTASLKRASGYAEFYALATQEKSPYDMVCDNTAYNASYNYPSACFNEFYNSGVGASGNLKYLKDVALTGYNNRRITPAEHIDKLLTYDGETLKNTVDDLVLGIARLNVGITMFQERSGGMYNSKKIAGLPFPEKIAENHDVQYDPATGSDDHIALLYTILFYDHGSALYNGRLYPANK